MRRAVLSVIVMMAGCGFRVGASGAGGDGPTGGDGPPGGDAPIGDAGMVDAPMIDAPMIDAPIDGPPLLPCPPAPSGCTEFTCNPTSCHYVCSDKRGWTSARDRCVSLGLGCLATVDDGTENTCITSATTPVFAAGTYVWIGFVQAASGMEPAGGWGWQCGMSAYRAPNWGAFEPSNTGGNEDCGLVIEGGSWIDGDCGTNARYVCEFPR